ncbi:hypothetical protein EsH8_VI_000687 [Colletotrichum jinshuiense]
MPSPGNDPVPKRFWVMVGGNGLSPPPTWNRLVSMTAERNKVRRDAENETREFQEARKKAKEELEAAKKAYKEAVGGGRAAWGQRKREEDADRGGDGTGREGQRTEHPDTGGDGAEASD